MTTRQLSPKTLEWVAAHFETALLVAVREGVKQTTSHIKQMLAADQIDEVESDELLGALSVHISKMAATNPVVMDFLLQHEGEHGNGLGDFLRADINQITRSN